MWLLLVFPCFSTRGIWQLGWQIDADSWTFFISNKMRLLVLMVEMSLKPCRLQSKSRARQVCNTHTKLAHSLQWKGQLQVCAGSSNLERALVQYVFGKKKSFFKNQSLHSQLYSGCISELFQLQFVASICWIYTTGRQPFGSAETATMQVLQLVFATAINMCSPYQCNPSLPADFHQCNFRSVFKIPLGAMQKERRKQCREWLFVHGWDGEEKY